MLLNLLNSVVSAKDVTDTSAFEKALHYPLDTTANFLKTTLCKSAVFQNTQSMQSYHSQRRAFELAHRYRDRHCRFSTHLQISGFRGKLLTVRSGLSDVPLVHTLWFWMFSLIGMTVPYRMWFASHCDEVKVAVTKSFQGR